MGHISIYTISNIIIVVGVIWAITGFFQYLQVVKMNNILHRLGAKAPRVFRGINGKFFALQMYVLAASDAEGKILDCDLRGRFGAIRRADTIRPYGQPVTIASS